MWIWESPWPLWLRLVLVIGLTLATVYTFFQSLCALLRPQKEIVQ